MKEVINLKKYSRIIIMLLILIMSMNSFGCKKQSAQKEKSINIYVDSKDKASTNVIKYFTEEYKKNNPNIKLSVNNSLGTDDTIIQDITKGNAGDIVFTTRNTMIELFQKGLLSDMGPIYEKNNISDKYYNVLASYGRIGDKYYGIGVMPYTVEFFYNIEALNKLKLTPFNNIGDLGSILKKVNASNIKIPVVLSEDLDIYNGLASIIFTNKIKIEKMEKSYGSSKEKYKNMKEMQEVFDDINYMVKEGILNKNTFVGGNESDINSLIRGDIPLLISTSYYNNNFSLDNNSSTFNIGILDDYSGIVNYKGTVPVIVSTIICIPVNGKNSEEVNDFIKFVFSEETENKLVEKGFITGNKKSNEKVKGIAKIMVKHLESSGDNNIIFTYNLPKQFKNVITSKIDSILSGKYTKKEWEEIVDEALK